jgi:hypothetical protein
MLNKPKRDKHQYYRVLVNETLQYLGLSIFNFRNLQASILESELGKEIPPDVLYHIDMLYQKLFDDVMDNLANANDLKVAHIAADGIEKSMRVRRGFAKMVDVL